MKWPWSKPAEKPPVPMTEPDHPWEKGFWCIDSLCVGRTEETALGKDVRRCVTCRRLTSPKLRDFYRS